MPGQKTRSLAHRAADHGFTLARRLTRLAEHVHAANLLACSEHSYASGRLRTDLAHWQQVTGQLHRALAVPVESKLESARVMLAECQARAAETDGTRSALASVLRCAVEEAEESVHLLREVDSLGCVR